MAKIKIFETEGNERDQNSQQLEFLSCQLFLVSDGTVRLETSQRLLTYYVSHPSKTTQGFQKAGANKETWLVRKLRGEGEKRVIFRERQT